MYPPPMIAKEEGISSRRRISSLSHAPASHRPGIGGCAGRVPKLRRTLSEWSWRVVPSSTTTSTLCASRSLALPRMKSIPGAAKNFSCAAIIAETMPFLCARSFSRSMWTLPVPSTPKTESLRASSRRRADATRDFVGIHATLMQVPPMNCRSMSATFHPCFARFIASDLPALPPPTTMRSKFSMACPSIYQGPFHPLQRHEWQGIPCFVRR